MTNTLEQTAVIDSGKTPKWDTYTPWYTIWTGAVFLLAWAGNDLDRIFNLYLLLVPIVGLPVLILAASLVISLAVSVFRQRWRRAISIIVAPIVAGSFFVLLGWLGITTELIRLELGKSSYLAQIDALPATDGGPRLKSWDWGQTGGAGVVNDFWTLVYDDSDQIALPASSRSADWLRNADQSARNTYQEAKGYGLSAIIHAENGGVGDQIIVRHLEGHFYVVLLYQ
jgi:hypothetical protein